MFRDVTSVLQDPDGLKLAIDSMIKLLDGVDFDIIAGAESRGFIFGMPIAYALGKAFIPVRKKGKLPCETVSAEYDLEYGKAEIEIHKDAVRPGQKVVLVDDLIATGGTMEASCKLVREQHDCENRSVSGYHHIYDNGVYPCSQSIHARSSRNG